MKTALLKEEAHKLVDKMPDGSTWDDLMDEIYVRQVIEQGLADRKAKRTSIPALRSQSPRVRNGSDP